MPKIIVYWFFFLLIFLFLNFLIILWVAKDVLTSCWYPIFQCNKQKKNLITYLNNRTANNHIREQVSIGKIMYSLYPNPIIPKIEFQYQIFMAGYMMRTNKHIKMNKICYIDIIKRKSIKLPLEFFHLFHEFFFF